MQRFQEWAPKFQEGKTMTKEISLESIDKVPIAMIAAANDSVCPYKTALQMKEIVGEDVKQFTTIEDEDHSYFAYASDTKFMNAVLEALEDIDGTGN